MRMLKRWPFSGAYSLADTGIFKGLADCHSHLIPGVDDGVRTENEALEILGCWERWGVAEVWITPHIMDDLPNPTGYLRECFEDLKRAYEGRIALYLAAEYMLDNLFHERLEKNDLLPLGKEGDHLLVEMSCYRPPMDLYLILEKIRAKGYRPVLAHPERYFYLQDADYRKLKERGLKFQLNLLSLTGAYGEEARGRTNWLLQQGMVDCWGSDVHRSGAFLESVMTKRLRRSEYKWLKKEKGRDDG